MGPQPRLPSDVLQHSSPEPLYHQLAKLLEAAVNKGALKPGDRLHSEAELSEHYGVSRITVRQAVEALARKQILVRKQGKGTFVAAAAVRHDLRNLHGLLGSLFSQAPGASARLLRYELSTPPVEVAGLFPLQAGDHAVALERLYLIDQRPVAITETWLHSAVAVLPRLKAELMSTEDMMRSAGIHVAATRVAIRACTAGAKVGRLLKMQPRSPVLELSRMAFGTDNSAKELGRIWFRSDSYELVCSTPDAAQPATLFDIRNVKERP